MLTRQGDKLLSSFTKKKKENTLRSVGIVLGCSVKSYDGSSFKCDFTNQNQNTVYIAIKRKRDDNSERKKCQGKDSTNVIGKNFVLKRELMQT